MQTSEFWHEVDRIFDALVELAPEERQRRLAALAETSPELAREVASLLEHATFEGTRVASAIEDAARGASEVPPSLEPGARVGSYTIVRRLGEGGMGEVYEATQEEPVRRTVALKLIRRGMDSPQVVARFESERQALALMDHPSIATVFDAGTTDEGRPYFVMELVEGETLDRFCDAEAMDIEERLRLFVAVCRGVHHAHQKGVIHRDLKPSNVLVTRRDGQTVPKVIDFGIAKATEGRLGERSVHTRFGQLVGTPEYMSPEQAGSLGADVDIRSDVFSLGALLYELLVGRSHLELDAKDFEGLLRSLRETEPVVPSRRAGSLDPQSVELVRRRAATTAALQRRLRGDLDWIVMRALEKDRERRYASAAELADDLERHLRNEPVLAGPPSRTYRLKKFVRRHRVGTLAATVAILSLLGGSTLATVGLVRARQAEREAVEEATAARQVSDFLVGVFSASNPNTERRAETTARELLDLGASQLSGQLEDQPAIRGRLLTAIGRVYESLGLFDQAQAQLEEGATLLRAVPGDELELSETLDQLASVLYRMQRDGSEEIAREALGIRSRMLDEADPKVGKSWKTLAITLVQKGDYEGAEEAFRRSLAIAEAHPDDAKTLSDRLQSVGGILDIESRPAEAAPYVERAIEVFEGGADPDDPWLGHLYDGLGIVRMHTEDYAGAETAFLRSAAQRERILGPDHHTVGESWGNIGELYIATERWDEAIAALERAISILTKAYGARHLRVINYLDNLGIAQAGRGDVEAGRATLQRSMALRDESIPRDHPDTGLSRQNLGGLELEAGNYARARRLLDAAWERRSPILGETHPEMLDLIRKRAAVAEGVGDLGAAQRLYAKAIALYEEAEKPDSEGAREAAQRYAALRDQRGQNEEAGAMAERSASNGS